MQAIRIPHNGYIEIIWELGIIGLLIFASILINLASRIKIFIENNEKQLDAGFVLASMMFFSMIVYHGYLNSITGMYHSGILLWFSCGLIENILQKQKT